MAVVLRVLDSQCVSLSAHALCPQQAEQIKASQQQPVIDLTQDKQAKPQKGRYRTTSTASEPLFCNKPTTFIDAVLTLSLQNIKCHIACCIEAASSLTVGASSICPFFSIKVPDRLA